MSLRGVKKAILRTPHQLSGKKYPQYNDETIAIWEHDLHTSISGLKYIESELYKYQQLFRELTKKQLEICQLMKNEDGGELKAEARLLQSFSDLIVELSDRLEYKLDHMNSDIGYRCRELTGYLDNLSKMLVKRNHKKADFEIHSNNFEKMITKKSQFSDKDMTNMKAEQDKMIQSRDIFAEIDIKVKLIIPESLEMFAEVLSKLMAAFQVSLAEIFSMIRNMMSKFAQKQGIYSESSDLIIKEWEQNFAEAKFHLDSMTYLKKYREGENHKHNSFLTTSNLKKDFSKSADMITTKAKHPKSTKINLKKLRTESPVKPKLSSGVFSSAVDPLSPVEYDISSLSSQINGGGNTSSASSPLMSSSPWLKPLSLRRQASLKDGSNSPQDSTFQSPVPSDDQETTVSTSAAADGNTNTAATTPPVEPSVLQAHIEALAAEIKHIKVIHSRRMMIDGCPVYKKPGNRNDIFKMDENLRAQISANSSLSSKLLKAHLRDA